MTTTATASSTTDPASIGPNYAELLGAWRDAEVLHSASSVLMWDMETMLPEKGTEARSEQMRMLAGLVHERRTTERMGELLAAAEGEASASGDTTAQANIRELRRDYDQLTKLPQSLVEEMTKTRSLAQHAWSKARDANDFAAFLPWLEKQVELNRRKAECLGAPAGGELYDALLDQYEPEMTAARTEEIFTPLRAFTVDLLERVRTSGADVDDTLATTPLPVEQQKRFVRRVVEAIGFDFEAGRMDDSTHPFCEGAAPGDTRLTNRYREDAWCDALSSGMHEAGHGMYEQGLPAERWGSPAGEAISLGIHESQSRMWENQIGRSLPFWEWALPIAQDIFGSALDGATPETMHASANTVQPSFIRVEADEVTYNLHIMLRFAMERAMLAGELKPKDLPGAWNERFKADFGLDVPDDRRGCLQDIHWSMGAIGYFPTYTFGNLYAAQLWDAMGETITNRDELVRRGEFAPILDWLRTNVHAHGRTYKAEDLCERITGKPLQADPLRAYLGGKVKAVYGV
jgi:carboxypeptidase Taq